MSLPDSSHRPQGINGGTPPEEPPSTPSPPPQSIARSAGVVSLAVSISRVLGLVREQVIAGLFGADMRTDAFQTAFRAPNLLRDLFAEGALSTAFVTTFSKKIATAGDQSAWRLANKVATLTAVWMSGITLLGILFAPLVIGVMAPGFHPEKAELTILLTRIMFPFILLVSLAALAMGMLNAKRVFGMPALASSFFNLGSILGGVGFGWLLDPEFGTRSLVGLALGTLLGGLLQLGVQFPPLFKIGFRFRPDFAWRDEGVQKILGLMWPAVIAASAVQVNVMVNTMFASFLEDGAQSWLGYAFRLMQLPLGLFGVAIGTVTLPLLASIASGGKRDEFSLTLAKGLRLTFLLTIPSAVGLMIMAEPVISLIFERGRFDEVATRQTAGALRFYALGLLGYSAIKVLAPAFYALDRRHLPMFVSLASIGCNVFLNWLLTFHFGLGHRGLALSTGLVAIINFVALYCLMHRELQRMHTVRMIQLLLRVGVATLGLGLICWLALVFGHEWLFSRLLGLRLAACLTTIGVAAAVFFGLCWLMGVQELQDFVSAARRKFFR